MAPLADVEQSAPSVDVGRLSSQERRWARIGAAVGVLVFVLLATWGQPWRMFEKGPYASDFFDAQATSILEGHLDIPAETAGVEGVVIDGRTQIYFGIGPAIMRLPLSGWNEELHGRLGIASMSIAIAVLALAAARMLGRSRDLVSPRSELDPHWFGVMAFGAVVCTPALFAASRSNVYHEAILWGCAASLAGLDLVIRWWRDPTRRNFVEAVAVAFFAVSCRFTSGSASTIGLVIFAVVLAFRRRWSRALFTLFGAFISMLGFVVFNWLRFRRILSQQSDLQVYSQIDEARKQFLEANGGRPAGPQFLPTTIIRYFSPFAIGWQRFFPFVKFGPLQQPVGDVVFDGGSGQSSSITLGAPVFFVLAVLGTWWTALKDGTREWTVIALAASIAALGTLSFGSIQHRYLIDLIPLVVVLACPGVWIVHRYLSGRSRVSRRMLLLGAMIVSILAVWMQVSLAIETRAFVMNPTSAETRSFLDLQNRIDRRLFGGSVPQLRQISGEELPVEGNLDGDVVILDDCAAVYRFSSRSQWIVVERKVGGGRRFILTGTIGEGETPVMRGWLWTLRAIREPDGVVFVYEKPDGYSVQSLPVELPMTPITLDIEADQSDYGALEIRRGDDRLFGVLGLGVQYPSPEPGWTSTVGSAPLCEALLARLEK